MKFLDIQAAIGVAIMVLSLPAQARSGEHLPLDVLHRRHQHGHRRSAMSPRASPFENAISRRATTCPFPTGVGLVAVSPSTMNAGWAMSPDQQCVGGSWCPYACPPGQVMAQWDPSAVAYTYPQSMNGGLKCNTDGTVTKPFPDKPYCVPGVGTVKVQNNFEDVVAICQTVLPGSESMLIPNAVANLVTLAVPDTSYWCKTAAHYYVNPPGISTTQGCVWGDESQPVGNWAPFVTGANQDGTGNTFLTLGWNPIFIDSPLSKTLPHFGLRIECDGNCVGTPCSINPSINGLNKVTSATSSTGAGGASFCVVTVPQGVTAHVVVFDVNNPTASTSSGPIVTGGASSGSSSSSAPSASASTTTTTAKPTTTVAPTATTTSAAKSSTTITQGSSTTTSQNSSSQATVSSTVLAPIAQKNLTSNSNATSSMFTPPGSSAPVPGKLPSAGSISSTWSTSLLGLACFAVLARLL